MSDKITVPGVQLLKDQKQKIVVTTAYDSTFAKLIDKAGVDIILVGDSLGMIIQGEDSTLPVTLSEMIYHTRCVAKAVENALIVADMPFLSYQVSYEEAVRSAGRLIKEGRAHAVKVERGGAPVCKIVEKLVEFDIPVMGHVGMTPQSIHRMGGFKQQGKTGMKGKASASSILEEAKALESAGAFSIVVECVPEDLARKITKSLKIPTIGIGSGKVCDGEVLVSYDLLGLTEKIPSFVKVYDNFSQRVKNAIKKYAEDVRR